MAAKREGAVRVGRASPREAAALDEVEERKLAERAPWRAEALVRDAPDAREGLCARADRAEPAERDEAAWEPPVRELRPERAEELFFFPSRMEGA